jgi:hypothetical protein
MVKRPHDYLKSSPDSDRDTYNLDVAKKKRIKNMPDVNFAIKTATDYTKTLELNLDVCHSLGEDIHFNDFLFSGNSWLHPGDEIDIYGIIKADVNQVFK